MLNDPILCSVSTWRLHTLALGFYCSPPTSIPVATNHVNQLHHPQPSIQCEELSLAKSNISCLLTVPHSLVSPLVLHIPLLLGYNTSWEPHELMALSSLCWRMS